MLDVGSANIRAWELRGQASNLRTSSGELEQYKNMIINAWQGKEVTYYLTAIGNAQARLNQAATELESLATTVSTTAAQIREEEEAAERARIAAEQARIAAELEAQRLAAEQAALAAKSQSVGRTALTK